MSDSRTADLVAHIEVLLARARAAYDSGDSGLGAVNWADLGVADIEFRLSLLHPQNGHCFVVLVEEAAPNSDLQQWLNDNLDKQRFPNTYIECEW